MTCFLPALLDIFCVDRGTSVYKDRKSPILVWTGLFFINQKTAPVTLSLDRCGADVRFYGSCAIFVLSYTLIISYVNLNARGYA